MSLVAITDYTFPSLEIEESILSSAGARIRAGNDKQVAAHLYGTSDAAKRQDTEATAALYGLRMTWPEDFPSWYLPGRTTLIVCTPLAGPAS